jgi:hypothetical protein
MEGRNEAGRFRVSSLDARDRRRPFPISPSGDSAITIRASTLSNFHDVRVLILAAGVRPDPVKTHETA